MEALEDDHAETDTDLLRVFRAVEGDRKPPPLSTKPGRADPALRTSLSKVIRS